MYFPECFTEVILKFTLIDDWHKAYSFYSVWFFAILGVAPDLFNLAVQYGVITEASAPAMLSHAIKFIAFCGAASRVVSQKKKELEAPAPVPEA
jgi:hypothetical protein